MSNKYKMYQGSFALTDGSAIADQMLSFTDQGDGRTNNCPLFQDIPDWKYITVDLDVTTLTGTSFALKGVTSNNIDNDLSITSAAATKGDGSTAFASASITATGSYSFTTGRIASTGAAASNIGALLGVWLDSTSCTAISGTFRVYVS